MSSFSSSHTDLDLRNRLSQYDLLVEEEGFVKWVPDAKLHPRNWPTGKKTYNVALVCFFEFWMTAISSSGTAASDSGRVEYGISRTFGYFIFTSLYLIGQATGSIVCSPISETFGRRTLYIVSIAVYCVFNVMIASVPSVVAVCFGRFITGFASATPATVAFGSFEDMYNSETRIWIVYIYTLIGNMGLVLGPIYSEYVTAYAGWRWVFYISSIVSGVGIIASCLLNESRTGYLLECYIKAIEKQTGVYSLRCPEKKQITLQGFAQESLFRPLRFLVTEPIVFCCAALMAISFSLIYGLTVGLTVVYTEFGFAESTTSSLAFIPLFIGLLINVLPRVYDQKSFTRNRQENRPVRPETKVGSLVTACPVLTIGLWLFAWTVPPRVQHVHWSVSMIGLILVGYATNDLSYILFGYLTDSYGPYAASACSALSLARTLMAAVFPLFTYTMYTGLGANVSTSIFAAVATVFCITPVVFIKYGQRLRKISRFAQVGENEKERDKNFAVGEDGESKSDEESASNVRSEIPWTSAGTSKVEAPWT